MKDLKDLMVLLRELGKPVAYAQFKAETELPYFVVISTGDTELGADNVNYYSFANYAIELYCDKKDPELEQQLEDHLRKNGVYYTKGADAWIDTEFMLMTPYYL